MFCDTILIRPYTLSDASDVYTAVNESMNEMSPWMPWCHAGYSVHDAINWIREQDMLRNRARAYEFAIVGPDDQYLGGCGVNQVRPEDRLANLGYWVRSAAAGQGIATRAVQLLCQWVFGNTDLVRLEIVVANTNIASMRVAEKAGAVPEGLQRERLQLNGRSHDAMMYSLVQNDLLPAAAGRRSREITKNGVKNV